MGLPMSRKSVPKTRPRELDVNSHRQIISTRLPASVGVARSSQLLPDGA